MVPVTTHSTVNPGGTECPGDNAEEWILNSLCGIIYDWFDE